MNIKAQIKGSVAQITLSGRFDFQLHREFRSTYTPLMENSDVREIEIELGGVDYLDSSALSMLMLLNERANGCKKTVTLLNPAGVTLHVLEVANFSEIFTISHPARGVEQ